MTEPNRQSGENEERINLVKENIDYELLLRHAAGFSCPLKGKTDPVKVKFAFVPFNFHSITT